MFHAEFPNYFLNINYLIKLFLIALSLLVFTAKSPTKKQEQKHDENQNVEKRQKKINETYSQLLNLSQVTSIFECTLCIYCLILIKPSVFLPFSTVEKSKLYSLNKSV